MVQLLPTSELEMDDLVASVPFFNGLNRDTLGGIRLEFGQLDVPRGTVLFRSGDLCSGIHVVVSGHVKVVLGTADGAEKVVDLAGPGQTLGETAVFLDRPHKTSAETLSQSRLLHIAKDQVFAAVQSNPGFARCIIAGLSDRLDRVIGDLESLTLHSGTERVVAYLLSRLDGTVARPHAAVTLPASKGIIASRLNLTQEHFSRILHDLTAINLIRVDGRDIAIANVDRLRAHAA